jgi:hypothetical protein
VPLDASIAYYWTSLGLSAAAVFLFLWLVRARRETPAERKLPPGSDPRPPTPGP